jgi:hypothetical protein
LIPSKVLKKVSSIVIFETDERPDVNVNSETALRAKNLIVSTDVSDGNARVLKSVVLLIVKVLAIRRKLVLDKLVSWVTSSTTRSSRISSTPSNSIAPATEVAIAILPE